MFSWKKLDIRGYQQVLVPNTFLQQDKATEHAAIVFPGLGYTCQGPALHYPTFELLARGADVLQVEYNTSRSEIHREEVEDAIAACQVLLQQRTYKQLTVIGKSLGTMVMGNLLTTQTLPLSIQAIWLTPIFKLPALQEQLYKIAYLRFSLLAVQIPIISLISSKRSRKRPVEKLLVIEGADHRLLIQGDVLASIHGMERVIRSIQNLLEQQK